MQARSVSIAPLLALRAHAMRFQPTPSELLLWRCLSARKLGVVFRRQVPIHRFIVDFLAPEVRLAVEVDGGCHIRKRSADARRDEKLRRLGYRVLRLDAKLVLRDLPAALGRVTAELQALLAR
jgi:very-short-patch-repair endonuclease